MARILSLDDEPEMLELLGLMLERMGYEHLKTTSSDEALSILRNEPIDLFTQDFMRPGVDGFEFLLKMKSEQRLSSIPVLGISAGLRDMRVRQLERVGLDMERDLDGYITKPFDPRELLDVVADILMRRKVSLPPKHAVCLESPIAALKDGDAHVRVCAAWNLGRMGGPGAVDALSEALSDESEWVRRQVALALERLGSA